MESDDGPAATIRPDNPGRDDQEQHNPTCHSPPTAVLPNRRRLTNSNGHLSGEWKRGIFPFPSSASMAFKVCCRGKALAD